MLDNTKNSNCDFAEQLVSYLYDELLGSEKTVFENHLNSCLVCKEELSGFSLTRTAISEWHQEEFSTLENPVIEIPYKTELKSNSVSLLDSIRGFLGFSPVWATALVLVIGIGLILTVIFSLPKTKNDILARNDVANTNLQIPIKDQDEFIASKENISITDDKIQATTPTVVQSSPQKNVPKERTFAAIKTSAAVKPQKKIISKPSQIETKRSPSLIDEDEEVASLRLTDLLDEIGTR